MAGIAIIGAGFTGTLVAAHLLVRARSPIRIMLIERGPKFGAGVAYGTTRIEHVLNVPAGNMSAFADDTGHFVRWAKKRDPSVTGGSFLPRLIYAEYLKDILAESQRVAGAGATLQQITDEVVDLDVDASDKVHLHLRSGKIIEADRVVLATGNPSPDDPLANLAGASPNSTRYVRDPWRSASGGGAGAGAGPVASPGALEAIDDAEPALLIGTGLTMLDVALTLSARAPQRKLIAVSRHGLLPQPHRPNARPPDPKLRLPVEHWPRTARGVLAALRAEIEGARDRRLDWRALVTALRPVTPRIWQSLDEHEKRRFLEHLRHFWDSHRHRIAPGPAAELRRLMEDGLITVLAARLIEVVDEGRGFLVTLQPRHRDGERLKRRVGWIVNCTGPASDFARSADPLMDRLHLRGLIHPDALGLGLLTDEAGSLCSSTGRASPVLFCAGPMRKAQLWESTAVPELRVQAEAIARHLLAAIPPAWPTPTQRAAAMKV